MKDDTIFITNRAGVVEFVNDAFEYTTGYSRREVLGRRPSILSSGAHDDTFYEALWKTLLAGKTFRADFTNRRKNGELYKQEQTITPAHDEDGNITHFVCHGRNVIVRRKAEETTSRLAAIVESSEDAIISLGLDTTVITWNSAAEKTYGYTAEEIVGKSAWLLVPPENAWEVDHLRKKLAQGDCIRHYETVRLKKGGERIDVAITVSPVKDEAGKITAVAMTARDITERKRMIEELRNSELKYRSLVENIPATIFIGSAYGHGSYISPQVEDTLGFSQAEWLGDPDLFLKQVHPEDREAVLAAIAHCRTTGRSVSCEHRMYTKDGRLLWNAVNLAAVRDGSDVCQNIQGVAFDITALKQSQKALQESENRYRRLVEDAYDMICAISLDGRIMSINRAGEEIIGFSRKEAQGMNFCDIVAPEYKSGIREALDSTLSGRTTPPREMEVIREDGRRVALELSLHAIVNEGIPAGVEGIGRDITERKKLEEQLRQAQKMEAIGQLAGGISHDFNNLLTVIKGYSDLLLSQTERDNPNYGDLEAIRNAADRAALLTRQLLAFSRRQVLQPTVLDLNVVVSNLSKMLRRLIGEHIEFSTILAQDLWLVKADAGQIEQVLMNLTVNARDAMPGGGQLIIETSNCQIDAEHLRERIHMKPGRYIELMVSDTGSGMTPETQSRIFEPFFTTKSTGKGTGLGLSTVYGIVKQSGGFIYVYSKPEKGTAFKIYLPETVDEATSSSSDMRPGRDSGTGLEFGKSVIDKPEVQGVACAMSKASARGRNRSAGPQPTLLQ